MEDLDQELRVLEDAALDAERRRLEDVAHAAAADGERPRTSWAAQDITREQSPVLPAYLRRRDDGLALIYPGLAHGFVGESETLKSFAALLACRSVYEAGGNVLYVDFESSLRTFQKRSRIVGLPLDPARVAYVRPDDPLDTRGATGADLVELGDRLMPALVVIDGVTEAFALHGWDINSATDAAKYHDLLLRRPNRTGAATLEIDHTPHGGTRSLGSQHKRAGLDGASYLFKRGRRGGVGKLSTAPVSVLKDREGEVRGALADSETVGTFYVDTRADVPEVYIGAPTLAGAAADARATMAVVAVWLGQQTQPATTSAVVAGVTGDDHEIRQAIERLVELGNVERYPGPRNAKLHRLVKDYSGS